MRNLSFSQRTDLENVNRNNVDKISKARPSGSEFSETVSSAITQQEGKVWRHGIGETMAQKKE